MHFISHTGQDCWVSNVFNGKRNGYFLDFGGFDGLMHSNTFYLEKFLGWQGILVEPNPLPYKSACAVRSCVTINAALWETSRVQMKFIDSHGLSSFDIYKDSDANADLRNSISRGSISVDTINPTELLEKFSAPTYIDYLSLDIEGAEFDVLKNIDLNRFKIALMSIEHNHNVDKQMSIRAHLATFGYEAIEHRNDDLFYNTDHLCILTNGSYSDPRKCQENVINGYRLVTY